MMKNVIKRKVTNRLLCVFAMVLLSACHCGQKGVTARPATMANPASVYCEHQGGRVSNTSSSKGIVGYCLLPDGEQVDEWVLYRRSISH